jgi:hypothetical protein
MDKPDRRIQIDYRIEAYQEYLSSEWAETIATKALSSATLDKMVLDLILAWRTVGYTACMPAASIQAMRSALVGYSHRSSSDANILAFGGQPFRRGIQSAPLHRPANLWVREGQ